MFSQEHRIDIKILGQCLYPWFSTMIFFLSLHVPYQLKFHAIEQWVDYVDWLGWTGVGKKEAETEKASLSALVRHTQSLYGRRSSSLHGNIFSYGKMYENLKGQAVC